MITIDLSVMTAFEEAQEQMRRVRYLRWLDGQQSLVGPQDRTKACIMFDAVLPEARQSGIDSDDGLFLYAAARLLMPDMDGLQYLAVMDLIISPLSQDQILISLLDIREHIVG